MIGVPEATPVRTPVPAAIVASAVLSLLHWPVPGRVASVKVVVNPTHTLVVPPIATGV